MCDGERCAGGSGDASWAGHGGTGSGFLRARGVSGLSLLVPPRGKSVSHVGVSLQGVEPGVAHSSGSECAREQSWWEPCGLCRRVLRRP